MYLEFSIFFRIVNEGGGTDFLPIKFLGKIGMGVVILNQLHHHVGGDCGADPLSGVDPPVKPHGRLGPTTGRIPAHL